MFKKGISTLAAILLIILLTACSGTANQAAVNSNASANAASNTANTTTSSSPSTAQSAASTAAQPAADTTAHSVTQALTENSAPAETAADQAWDSTDLIAIQLDGASIRSSSANVLVNGSMATITSAGNYSLKGALTDGQIVVNSPSSGVVRLILDGVNITSANSAPINVVKAREVVIVLADGSQNTVTDSANYVFETQGTDEPNAAIFSKADLQISGSGSLTVNAKYNDGISSKDGLIISGGTFTINAVDDGIRGKDYLLIKDGAFTLNTQGDGLKSDNETDASMGYISIEKGTFQITSGGDAITALTDVLIQSGTFNLAAGGGSSKSKNNNLSQKGIKGAATVTIDGGTFKINSADDGLHTNNSLVINGGTFEISTSDDALHSDATLTINGGEVQITKSYEGIEAVVITINAGTIHVNSSDDGINGAGGTATSGQGGRPGQTNFNYTGKYYLYVNGGNIMVTAGGDGVDVNGAIEMTAGTLLVNGPTAQNNGALDYDAYFKMTGGMVAATGSSGMALAPSTNSTQYAIMVYFSAVQKAGTIVHIQSRDGTEILTLAPNKPFQSLAFSSPALTKGATYLVFTGGSSTGTLTDGLYSGGTYTGGTQAASLTLAAIVTTSGSGGQGGRMRP